jgi:hypothetical protein
MNRNNRIAACVGLVLLLVCATFPPWRVVGWGLNGQLAVSYDVPVGWAFVLTGPSEPYDGIVGDDSADRQWVRIDSGRLLVEIAIIISAAGLACVALAPRFQ